MNQNQMAVAEQTKFVDHMETFIDRAMLCEEADLQAIAYARELLGDLRIGVR
jgi:hypothetical protein